jgi:hypothetical protein
MSNGFLKKVSQLPLIRWGEALSPPKIRNRHQNWLRFIRFPYLVKKGKIEPPWKRSGMDSPAGRTPSAMNADGIFSMPGRRVYLPGNAFVMSSRCSR